MDEIQTSRTKAEGMSHGMASRVSAEADDIFELMTADVIAQLCALRAERIKAAVVAAWHGWGRDQRARRAQAACVSSMAKWNSKHVHFYALLEHQQQCDLDRQAAAFGFWSLRLVERVFCAWGPLFKLHLAERIGEADRAMRRAVLRCSVRAAFDRWGIFSSLGFQRGKLRCPRALAAVKWHAYLQRCSSASFHSWRTETEKRVATLNQPLADLRQRSLCRLLSHAWQDFAVGVQTNTHLVKCMLARRAWNMLFDAALRRRQLLEASAWHVSDLQRRCVWCWKDLLKERKRVAIMIGRFREDWTRMHAILGGKQMLESWSQQVQLERTREADLVNLLEYFNKDVQVALNCLADAFETWRLVITEEATRNMDRAVGHVRVYTKSRFVLAWHKHAVEQRVLRQQSSTFAAACLQTWSRARCRWMAKRLLEEWLQQYRAEVRAVAQLDPLIASLQVRRRLYAKRDLVLRWREAVRQQMAKELLLTRHKKLVYEAWGCWLLLLQDACVLYPQEWGEAVKRDRIQLMRGVMLSFSLHQYKEEQRQAHHLQLWGRRWLHRCWCRWWHVHTAIGELRLRSEHLNSLGAAIVESRRARRTKEALWQWRTSSQNERKVRSAQLLCHRRSFRVRCTSFAAWRQRAAWWSDSWILCSYRSPTILASWSSLRLSWERQLLRMVFDFFQVQAARTRQVVESIRHSMCHSLFRSISCRRIFSGWAAQVRTEVGVRHECLNERHAQSESAAARISEAVTLCEVVGETHEPLVHWRSEQHPWRSYTPVNATAASECASLVEEDKEQTDATVFDTSGQSDAEVSMWDSVNCESLNFSLDAHGAKLDVSYCRTREDGSEGQVLGAEEEYPRSAHPQPLPQNTPPQRLQPPGDSFVRNPPLTPTTPSLRVVTASTPGSALSEANTIPRALERCRKFALGSESPSLKNLFHQCARELASPDLHTSTGRGREQSMRTTVPQKTASTCKTPLCSPSDTQKVFATSPRGAQIWSPVGSLSTPRTEGPAKANTAEQGLLREDERREVARMLQYGLTKRNGIATSMTAHDFLKLPASHSFLQQPLVIKEEGWDTLIVPDGAAALAALQKRFDLRFSLPCSPVRAGTQSRGQSEPDALLVQKYVADPLLLLGGHKFDLNVYVVMLILPRRLLCFYHDGFLRFGQQVYSPPSSTHAYAASHDDREPAYSTNLAPQQGSAPSFASFDQLPNRMCLTHPGEEDLGDASTVDRPVVEHHLKPRIKDALREALATAAPSLHALVSPAVSAADGAAGHVEESELARDCGDSDEASLSWCLLSAKFLIDQQLGVHLLNFNGVPQISFPDCMEVDEGLTRMKHEAIEIAVQALRLSSAPHVGKMECIECVEEFEFLYDESV